jgi:hypothetical protein
MSYQNITGYLDMNVKKGTKFTDSSADTKAYTAYDTKAKTYTDISQLMALTCSFLPFCCSSVSTKSLTVWLTFI